MTTAELGDQYCMIGAGAGIQYTEVKKNLSLYKNCIP